MQVNHPHVGRKEFVMAHPSIAHTYGNVASIITEYVKGLFLPTYFRTVHVHTAMAYKQIALQRARNKEFYKKSKPMLIVRPRIELNDSDNFMYGTFLTQRFTDQYANRDFSNLQPFLYDKMNGVELKYLLNRLKMYFDVSIITETQMEQINIAHYLMNQHRFDKPINLEVALESFIPTEIINVLSKEYRIPLKDKDNSVQSLLNKLNSISYYPITYKLKKSTGNQEFFRYYPALIDTTIGGFNINDGSKKGMVYDAFEVSFVVSAEFNATGFYYYFTYNTHMIDEIRAGIKTIQPADRIMPIFTISNLFDLKLPEGWELYTTRMYNVEPNEDGVDILPIEGVLNNSIRKTIDHHTKNGMPLNHLLIFRVMCDNQELQYKRDFDIDYTKGTLITKKIDEKATYRLIVYANIRYINELVKKEYDLE